MNRSRTETGNRRPDAWAWCLIVVSGFAAAGVANGCANHARAPATRLSPSEPNSRSPAYSLGNLRIGRTPSKTEVQLAQFLFGVEPEAGLMLIKPMDLVASAEQLRIAEGAFQRVLRWTPQGDVLFEEPLNDAPAPPGALALAPDGDLLIATATGSVQRFRAGAKSMEYRVPSASGRSCRVGGIACVRNEIWITNLTDHRIEVFDAAGAQHLRSIGRRGAGAGEFGLPLGIVAHNDEIFIADMLNARVQVLDVRGVWLRNVGSPGNRLGYFGRPRGLAIGPDGTLFVVDATLQRVTAFTTDGVPLTAFGGANDTDPLVLPAGITIWQGRINAGRDVPPDFTPAYYVLVSEQISRPGIRAFAWRTPAAADYRTANRPPPRVAAKVANPHFDATRCDACHVMSNGRPQTIPPERVDALCLTCHDGNSAVAEAHPIGRIAETPQTRLPPDRPVVDGRITCLTCHDIRRQCDNPVPPPGNTALVRGHDPLDPMSTCKQCHTAPTWRINPHQGAIAGANSPVAGCGYCHTLETISPGESEPDARGVDANALGRVHVQLRDQTTRLCLNCHAMHADPAPQGHLQQRIPASILSAMSVAPAMPAPAAADAAAAPADPASATLLPLENGAITCATCHNPHPPGADYAAYFHRSAARLRSSLPEDEHKALRLPHVDLCLHCHPR